MRIVNFFQPSPSSDLEKSDPKRSRISFLCVYRRIFLSSATLIKLTWLALGEDQAALSRKVEQLTALLGPVKP